MTPQTFVAATAPVTRTLPLPLRDRLHSLLNLAIYHFTDVIRFTDVYAATIFTDDNRDIERAAVIHHDGSIEFSPRVVSVDYDARIVFLSKNRVFRFDRMMETSERETCLIRLGFYPVDSPLGDDCH